VRPYRKSDPSKFGGVADAIDLVGKRRSQNELEYFFNYVNFEVSDGLVQRSCYLVTIQLITYVVAISKLSHIIAGSVEASYAVMTGAASVQDYLLGFFAPTLLGNMIGGISLVAIINHGSIAAEITDTEPRR
jgi:hypothetical protein